MTLTENIKPELVPMNQVALYALAMKYEFVFNLVEAKAIAKIEKGEK